MIPAATAAAKAINLAALVFVATLALSVFFYSTSAHSATYLVDDARQDCPAIAEQEHYQAVLKHYGPRMRDPYTRYGCDVVPLYYAFEGAEAAMDLLEQDSNDELLRSLVVLIKNKPALAEALHNNNKLSTGFAFNLAGDQDSTQRALETLASLEKIGERDSAYAALLLLIPGAPPLAELKRQMPPKEAELVLATLQLSALTSDGEYESFLSDTPRNTLDTYKMLIRAWGESDLQRVLRQTPDAVPALRPPMLWSDLLDLVPASRYSPDAFKTMQKNYVEVQRDLYRQVRERHGAAWAAEASSVFSLPLAMNLLDASADEVKSIRSFLVWLTTQSDVFSNIVRPSACENISNMQKLAHLISGSSSSLHELAQWHKNGRLDEILNQWAKNSAAVNFQQAFQQSGTGRENADLLFWSALIPLANVRNSLGDDNGQLLDNLIFELKKEDPLWMPMLFMSTVANTSPFFDIMENRDFKDPKAVALRLLDFGYPYSNEPSLFERFRRDGPRAFTGDNKAATKGRIDMAFAIQERGLQPEAEIMKDGLTFKDKVGFDPETLWLVADVVVFIGEVAVAVPSGGATAPAAAAQAARIGTRFAAKTAMRQVVKAGCQ